MERVNVAVRTGLGEMRENESFDDFVEHISRIPLQRNGYQVVRYRDTYYRLAGGIRTVYFISLNLPMGKA